MDASEEWTGNTMLRDKYDYARGAVFSDQGGTLHIEQSIDGENWDVDTSYTVTANDGSGFTESLVCPFWRLRYENGGTEQEEFRIGGSGTASGEDA